VNELFHDVSQSNEYWERLVFEVVRAKTNQSCLTAEAAAAAAAAVVSLLLRSSMATSSISYWHG